jgi:hypothetical protein
MEQQGKSKYDWFKEKLRNGFFLFKKGEFPKFTGTDYDPLIFSIVNSAYITKNRLDDLYRALDPFISFDDEKNEHKIVVSNTHLLKEMFLKDNILSGLKVFELNPKGTSHLDFLEELGASVPDYVRNHDIPISGENAVKLRNQNDFVNEKYDITFSNGLMDENSGIKYENHSAVFSAFELFALYSNITKKKGFSLHANGTSISSLYETYFQFIGFKVIEYFRNSEGSYNFTIIMKKINEKQTDYENFSYIYSELKMRWPTRYGN